MGGHCLRTWSSTQGAVALSSAEAEFYAMVDGVQKAKWAATIAGELGCGVDGSSVVLGTDCSAAKSFVARRGLGKMRHMEVRDLWLQEEVIKGKVRVIKIPGETNPADLMTKYLGTKEIEVRLDRMGIEVRPERWRECGESREEGDGKLVKGRWSEEEGEEEAGLEETLQWWKGKETQEGGRGGRGEKRREAPKGGEGRHR